MQYLIFNRKSSLLGLGLLLGSMILDASPVSQQVAENVARNWMQQLKGKSYHVKRLSTPTVTKLGVAHPSKAQYHIVQMEEGGWVIVAGDDVARPVLGYGFSKLDPAKLPPSMMSWLEGQSKIISAVTNRQKSNQKLGASLLKPDPEWEDLMGDTAQTVSTRKLGANVKLGRARSEVNPLLWLEGNDEESGIRWGQSTVAQDYSGAYTKHDTYNYYTPTVPGQEDKGHTLTGCVATAMGQVLYYYWYNGIPINALGSHQYTISRRAGYQYDIGSVGANFGDYRWEDMTLTLNERSLENDLEAVKAISKLLFHLGVAVEMDYGYGMGDYGSLANYCSSYYEDTGECLDMESDNHSAMYALRTYFGIKTATWARKKDYPTLWETMLQDSLDNCMPVLYGGSGTGGHAFVLDGYATEGYYHFNWGYDGQGNGWSRLDPLRFELNGDIYDFSDQQQAVFLGGSAIKTLSEKHKIIGREKTTNTTSNNDPMVGGGCTYNPHSRGVDLMMILMVILSALYPIGRRYLR